MKPRDRITGLLDHVGNNWISSAKIAQICGLGSWRFYPAIVRLENDGLVESKWELDHDFYPRRRLYRIKQD